MVKKLYLIYICEDSVKKIDLHIGNNIIGHGLATGYNDKQVPEYAVIIHVSPDGEIMITPQIFSCFMKSIESTRWVSIESGSTVPVQPGSLFSFLPHKLWFKVISVDDIMEKNAFNIKRKTKEEVTNEQPPDKKVCSQASVETLLSPNEDLSGISSSVEVNHTFKDLNPPEEDAETNEITTTESPPRDDASCSKEDKLAVALPPTDVKSSSSKIPTEQQVTSPSPSLNKEIEEVKEIKGKSSSADKVASSGNEEVGKKIKWDCNKHFSDQNDRIVVDVTQKTTQPSTSGPQNLTTTSTVVTSQSSRRNRCTYGRKCYRQGADHRAQFSHPGDADYDIPDNRPECRYGIRCYRKNPQHRKDFKHTIRRRQRAQTPVRARTPETTSGTDESSIDESVDESDYDPSWCIDSSDDKSDWDDV